MSDTQEDRKRPAVEEVPTEEHGGDIPPPVDTSWITEIMTTGGFDPPLPPLQLKYMSEETQKEIREHHAIAMRNMWFDMVWFYKNHAGVSWITWDPEKEFPDPAQWLPDQDPPRMYYGNCFYCKKAGQYGQYCVSCNDAGMGPAWEYPLFKPMEREEDGAIFNPLFVSWYYGHPSVALTPIKPIRGCDEGTWYWRPVYDVGRGYDPALDDENGAGREHKHMKIKFWRILFRAHP